MITIAELNKGERARIIGLVRGDQAYRRKLLALGLLPGTEFLVKRFAPLGDPVEISVRGCALSLRKREAALLQLERVSV